jgi:hypothetical protein
MIQQHVVLEIRKDEQSMDLRTYSKGRSGQRTGSVDYCSQTPFISLNFCTHKYNMESYICFYFYLIPQENNMQSTNASATSLNYYELEQQSIHPSQNFNSPFSLQDHQQTNDVIVQILSKIKEMIYRLVFLFYVIKLEFKEVNQNHESLPTSRLFFFLDSFFQFGDRHCVLWS